MEHPWPASSSTPASSSREARGWLATVGTSATPAFRANGAGNGLGWLSTLTARTRFRSQACRSIFVAALPLLLADIRQRTRRRAVQEGVRSPSTGLERFRQRMAQWHKVKGKHEETLEQWIEDDEFDQLKWERFVEKRQEEFEALAEQGHWDEFARLAASSLEADLLDAAVRIALRHGMVEYAWEELLKRSLRWPSRTDEAWRKLSKGAQGKLDLAQAHGSSQVAIKALGAHYQPTLDAEAQARESSSEEPEEEKVDSENPLAIAEEVLAATKGKALVDLRFEFAITEANVASRMRTEGRKALFEKVRKDLRSIGSTAKKMRIKVRTLERWNMLVSLMGNSNHLPLVFEVTDLMERLRVQKDDETMSRLAPAAVREVSFHIAADSFETMPQPELPEIVFVGRSNTGKSSLVNALLGMPALAPVAAMPGKTTRFHFYAVNKTSKIKRPLSLVDVPGLGVAVAVEDQMQHWKTTLFQYFQKRGPTLRGVFHLIDSEALVENGRLSPEDEEIMNVVKAENIEYTMVLTKVDIIAHDPRGKQLTRQLISQLKKKRGKNRKGALPKVVPSSTKTGVGREQLWKRLWSCFDPMNPRWEGQDLATVQSELDDLISDGEADELVARADSLFGEAWEYALRGLVKLGHCTTVWDLIEERLRGAEEGGGKISFTPAQARVTLVVAEAALRGDARDLDEAGCEDIANKALDFLQRGKENATAIEVMLELVVADAKRAARALESGGSAYSDSRAKVLAGLTNLTEKSKEWQVRPWSIDRWNSLLASLAGVQDLEYLHRIIDTMRAMRIREGETLHTIVAGATVRCSEEVAAVSMITDLPTHDLPEVIFVGGGGKCAESPFLGPLLTQRDSDEEAATCRLSFVNKDDDQHSGLRPFALVQVPLPSIPEEGGFMAEEAVSDWSDSFYAYLEQRKASGTPVHVFHSINAKHFTSLLQGRYRNWSEHALDEAVARAVAAVPEAMVGEQASVTLVDMVVQAAAKRSATSYTAVIADCELLGMDKVAEVLQGKAHRLHAHPRVVARREAALRDEIGAKLAGCEVILANTTTCRGATEIWRSLWEALAQREVEVPASRQDGECSDSSSST